MSKERTGDWIDTYAGRKFYVLDPRPEDFCIEDVAHALSLVCRYGGHCDKFYSVAEHSCILADYARDRLAMGTQDVLRALMHDAVEAYVGDVPRPIKHTVVGLEAAEAAVEQVLMGVFGLPFGKPDWLADIDLRIIKDEREVLMPRNPGSWWTDGLESLGVKIEGWPSPYAEEQFLGRYYDLMQELGGGQERPY